MHIGIFGLGYVGLTTAACFLERHFRITGYELSSEKRKQLENGRCPLSEPGVEEALIDALSEGTFTVSESYDAKPGENIVFICVGTPNSADGDTDLTAVRSVLKQLENFIKGGLKAPEIVIRSTMPPGTLKKLKSEYTLLFNSTSVVFYPEFLREGTAMRDFYNPPQTIVGILPDGPTPKAFLRLLSVLGFDYVMVDSTTAEAVKFASNSFHALKVCFANEIARYMSTVGGDGAEVMKLFIKDTILNISAKYLLPGAPYGGSCLPKEIRSLKFHARKNGMPIPLIENCEISNMKHYEYILECVNKHNVRNILILGLSFKKDTDDIRESPSLTIARSLSDNSDNNIMIHDYLVQPEKVVGVNKILVDELLIKSNIKCVSNVQMAMKTADIIVIMHPDERYEKLAKAANIPVINVATWSGVKSISDRQA